MMSKLTNVVDRLNASAEERVHEHRREAHAIINKGKWFVSGHQEMEMLKARRGEHSWNLRCVHFFHQNKMQFFFIALLLIDVVVIFVELFIEAEFPRCELIRRDAVSCCDGASTSASGNSSGSGSGSSADIGHSSGHHALCSGDLYQGFHYEEGSLTPDCDEHKWETVHMAHVALFGTSVGILAVFEMELILLFVALDVQFFHNLLYVIDLFVVTSSLALELVLKVTSFGDLAGLLILARLWRFMRVAHGMATVTHEAKEHDTHASPSKELAKNFEEAVAYIQELEEEIVRLKGKADVVLSEAE